MYKYIYICMYVCVGAVCDTTEPRFSLYVSPGEGEDAENVVVSLAGIIHDES